jgi:tetratricopeptide (TPR) repeat protein
VNLKDYEEALKLLYKLNYENPEDSRVNRVLAWTHLCSGNIEQADKIYKKLMGVEKPLAEDLQNYGYCCWFSGKVDEAADSFRKYLSLLGSKHNLLSLFDTAFLRERGISDTQIKLMEALVSS